MSVLSDELTNDPLALGYSGMDAITAAAKIMATDTGRTVNITSLTGTQVINAIDKTEFNALTAVKQTKVWNVLHLGNINPFGIEADLFIDAFGGGSTTITALQSIRKKTVSRAAELGLSRIRQGEVEEARL